MCRKIIATLLGVFVLVGSLWLEKIAYAQDAEYSAMQTFRKGFVPLLEKSAKKKKEPLSKVLKDIENLLVSMLSSPTADSILKKKVTILLELLRSDMSWNKQDSKKNLVWFEQCLKGKWVLGEIEREFTSNVYTGEIIADYEKTDIAHTPLMQELKKQMNESNWMRIWFFFDNFVSEYEWMGWKRENALLQTETDFRLFKKFVKPWDLITTLRWYSLFRWIYGIQWWEKLPEWRSHQLATTAWFQRKAVCAGLARLALLLFSLAGYGDNFDYFSPLPNHAALRIENLPAPRSYYDPTSAGFDETSVWKHVGDEPNWRKGLDIPQYPSYEEATISNGVITHQLGDEHTLWLEQQELKFKQDALSLYGIDRDRVEEYRSEYLEEREKNRLKKLVPSSRPTYEQLLKKSGEEFERNLETVQREFCERKFNITSDITKNINSQSKTSHRLSQSSQTQNSSISTVSDSTVEEFDFE